MDDGQQERKNTIKFNDSLVKRNPKRSINCHTIHVATSHNALLIHWLAPLD